MFLPRVFNRLFSKEYVCWICLDTECDNDEWIVHQCGCNLQVHRKCLIGWMYELNKAELGNYYTYDTYKINSSQEIIRRLCYLVDKNRDMGRDIGFAETIQNVPLMGQTVASFYCVGDILFRALARLNMPEPSFSYDDLWRGLPHDTPRCPQCKEKIVKHSSALQYSSSSMILKLFSLYRRVTRYSAAILTLCSYFLNPLSWISKLGLWQLRSLFSESALREILNISNTKALDVYIESMKGLLSLPLHTQISIASLPLFLYSYKFDGLFSLAFGISYPYILLKNYKGHKIINDTISCHGLAIALFKRTVGRALNDVYAKWIQEYNPYFLPRQAYQKRTAINSEYTFVTASEAVDFSDMVIKSQWSDSLLSAITWPFVCKFLGQKLFSLCPSVNDWILRQYPSATPDECTMVHTFICSFSLYVAYDLFQLGVTYLRLKEVEEVQKIAQFSASLEEIPE